MIRLRKADDRVLLLNPAEISSVTQAGAASQWHGTRAFVRMRDGQVHDVQDPISEIERQLAQEKPE